MFMDKTDSPRSSSVIRIIRKTHTLPVVNIIIRRYIRILANAVQTSHNSDEY